MNASDFEWLEVIEDPDHCGGPEACEGRKYDASKTDCQKCINDMTPEYDMDGNETL